jgi:phage repressor protein C with HTH and peptisase S24 domain
LEPGIYASSSDHLVSGSTMEEATITVNGNAMVPTFTDGDLAIPVKTGFAFDPSG